MLTRRRVLAMLGSALAAPALLSFSRQPAARPLLQPPPKPAAQTVRDVALEAKARRFKLFGPDGPDSTLWTYGDELFPILRLKQGERLRATIKNSLTEHTSIHWHGVRVPNEMDGVQYVTQKPIEPGESRAPLNKCNAGSAARGIRI